MNRRLVTAVASATALLVVLLAGVLFFQQPAKSEVISGRNAARTAAQGEPLPTAVTSTDLLATPSAVADAGHTGLDGLKPMPTPTLTPIPDEPAQPSAQSGAQSGAQSAASYSAEINLATPIP